MNRAASVASRRWGNWEHDPKNNTLFWAEPSAGPRWEYWIALDKCTSAVEILDWIRHLSGKRWCSAEDLRNLISALDEVAPAKAWRR